MKLLKHYGAKLAGLLFLAMSAVWLFSFSDDSDQNAHEEAKFTPSQPVQEYQRSSIETQNSIETQKRRWVVDEKQFIADSGVFLLMCFHTPVWIPYQHKYNNTRGKPHKELIKRVIASITSHSPGLPIAVATDDREMLNELGLKVDRVIMLQLHQQKAAWQEKLFALPLTPFRRTIYMDTDSIVCANLHSIFAEFKKYPRVELAATRVQEAAEGKPEKNLRIEKAAATKGRLPITFEFYTAFMYYRLTSRMLRFFNETTEAMLKRNLQDMNALNFVYQTMNFEHDDAIHFHYLSSEFFHVTRKTELPSIVSRSVAVVHGVDATCEVNAEIKPRVIHNGKILRIL